MRAHQSRKLREGNKRVNSCKDLERKGQAVDLKWNQIIGENEHKANIMIRNGGDVGRNWAIFHI